MSPRLVNLFAAAVFFAVGFVIGCSAWTPQTEGDRVGLGLKVGAALAVASLACCALL